MNPQWESQRFPPEGGPTGEGISQQLGRPKLDPLTVLVREAAQNSWDARLDPSLPVEFTLHLRRLGDLTDAWRGALLPGPHLEAERGITPLEDSIADDRYMLIVSDRNTRGLGGPLRADVKAPDDVVANFVQFLRNVGEPSDQKHGGGTYGYGKGILYGLSASNTIVVDTRTVDGVGVPRRLMGSALGHSFYDGDIRYTGRHWWGLDADELTNPVTDDAAAALADGLGLPGFGPDEFGTDIAIVGFDLGRRLSEEDEVERSPKEAAEFLASSILWNLWPKMGSGERPVDMEFRLMLDGEEIAIPNAKDTPALRPFVQALDALERGEVDRYLRTKAPKDAGSLAVVDCVANPAAFGPVIPTVAAAMPFEPPYRQVARMRVPELVVDYFEGPVRPLPDFGYAGVFRASPDADRIFAVSEPPTHDDWVDQGLTGSDLGVVRFSRSFIKSTLTKRFMDTGQGNGELVAGLGGLAAALGSIIPTTAGVGPGPGGGGGEGPGGGGGSRGSRPRIVKPPRVKIIDGSPQVVAQVRVPASAADIRLEASAFVAVDGGGREAEPPLGGSSPSVIGWGESDQSVQTTGQSFTVPSGQESHWFIFATYLPDTSVGIDLKVGD